MLTDVPLFWSSHCLLGQVSSLCANSCLILNHLSHIIRSEVFSCSTWMLGRCPVWSETDFWTVGHGSGSQLWVTGTTDSHRAGVALYKESAMVPTRAERRSSGTNTAISSRTLSIHSWALVQHWAQQGAKPSGDLWVEGSADLPDQCPALSSHVFSYLFTSSRSKASPNTSFWDWALLTCLGRAMTSQTWLPDEKLLPLGSHL